MTNDVALPGPIRVSKIRGLLSFLAFKDHLPAAAEVRIVLQLFITERPGRRGPVPRALIERPHMTRKILTGLVAVLLSVATGASAATISTHGAAFVAYNVGQAQNVDYTLGGARTNLAAGQTLVASVARNTITAGNQTFTLWGWHNGVRTSNCSIYSALVDGSFIASKSLSVVDTAGIWTRTATMTAAELPSNTKVAVLCTVPGSFNGHVSGVTATP